MRRPARVKAYLFVGPAMRLIADQREAHNLPSPCSQIIDLPYFPPHSWRSYCSGASDDVGCLRANRGQTAQIHTGANLGARDRQTDVLYFYGKYCAEADSAIHAAAIRSRG